MGSDMNRAWHESVFWAWMGSDMNRVRHESVLFGHETVWTWIGPDMNRSFWTWIGLDMNRVDMNRADMNSSAWIGGSPFEFSFWTMDFFFFFFKTHFVVSSKSYVAWIDYLDFLICFQGGEWHENISWCLGMFEYFYLCLDLKNPFDITLIWIHGEFSQTTDWFFPAAGPASYILLGQNCLQSYRCRHHHPKLYIIVYMQT